MAAMVVGFSFADGLFFNSLCTREEVKSLEGELGEWSAPGLAAQKASHYGLSLQANSFLKEVKIGGFKEARQIGVFHQFGNSEEQVCVENPPSREIAHTEAQVSLESQNDENVHPEGVSWTHEKVLLLIEEYREHLEMFSNSAIKRHEVWRKIALRMQGKGHHVTGDICDKKFRSLKNRYKIIADGNQSSGRGKRRWEYFEVLEDLFAGDPAVRPVSTVSSLTGIQTRQTTPQKSVVPSTSTSQSPSTLSSPSASTTQSPSASAKKSPCPDFCDRRSNKRKRASEEPPQWFFDYATRVENKMENLKKDFQEKNHLLKEKNNILKEKNNILKEKNNLLKEKNELLKSYIQQRPLPPPPGSSE